MQLFLSVFCIVTFLDAAKWSYNALEKQQK